MLTSVMSYSLRYRLHKREYTRIRNTEFFPAAFNPNEAFCLGTKSRNLGDALILTPLFSKLQTAHPQLKMQGFIRAFNPVVIQNFSNVTGISRAPKKLYGDDINLGSGHMIEQKLRWFGLPFTADEIRPVILLDDNEKQHSCHLLKNIFGDSSQPLWIIHPWGKTWKDLLSDQVWQSWISLIPQGDRILQIGMPGEKRITGAQFFQLDPTTHDSARILFALMAQAQKFIGVDSGPMHVASAFSIPALILVHTASPGLLARGLELRHHLPYFHRDVRHFANLYDHQSQIETSDPAFRQKVSNWIQA